MAQKEIPCYLFVGMLESGKTKFIQETMEDPQFDSGDKTLLLICEEGEEEYDSERFAFGGVTVATIEDKAELNREHLQQLAEKSDCGRVIIEYNGMWLVQELYDALPDNWLIYQCLATADGTTIKTYANDNAMRGLLLDKLRGSELLVVNRAEAVNDDESHQLIHKLVRQASRRCDIAYEFKDGSVAYDDIPKVAVVGKPNVGKSSLINKLLGEDRVIVSDIAGTTRDAVDAKVKWKDREYIFIDTAGLRRKGKIKEEIERYSVIRTVTAVERADVVVVVIDATEGVTEQDAKIAGIAHERGKGVIIAVNKWDAVEKDDKTIYKHTNRIREVLAYMPYAELVFISAKSGQRLPKLFETIDAVIENQTLRIQTGVLNEILSEAVAMQQPPSDRGKRLKIFYMTQVGVKPPTFVIFVNDKELMHFSYTRYIENKVRDAFGFRGTSLKFIIRERGEKS